MTAKTAIKPRNSTGNRYSPATWGLVRGLYESGTFKSIEELRMSCGNALRDCPSGDAIEKRMKADRQAGRPWNKHEVEEAIVRATERSYQDLFEELGMGRKRRVELVIEGVKSEDLDIRNKFITTVNKLLGDNAPEKVKINGNLKSDVKDYDAMTEQELEAELVRVRSAKLSGETGEH